MTSAATHRRELPPTLLVGLASLVLQLLVVQIRRPLNLPDEAGYILNAIRIGAGEPASGLDYFPGYSLLLAPAATFTQDLSTLTLHVQVVNGLLGALTASLAVHLATKLAPTLGRSSAIAIGLVTASYPSFRLFAAFALSENLVVPSALALCILIHRCATSPNVRTAAVLGLAAGSALAIHPRAVALPIAVLATGVHLLWQQRRALTGLVAGLAIGLLGSLALVAAVVDVDVNTGAQNASVRLKLSAALTPSGLLDLVASAAGQLFYLTVGSAGVILLGLIACITSIVRSVTDDRPGDAVRRLAATMFVASLGISSLFLAGASGDFAIYGRYIEAVVVPLLVIGLLHLRNRVATIRWEMAAVVCLPPVLALFLLVTVGPERFEGRTLLLNIAAVFPVVDYVGGIRLPQLATFGIAFTVVTILGFQRHFLVGAGVLCIPFLAAAQLSIDRSAAALVVLDKQDELLNDLAEVRVATGVECVALDIWQLPDRWHQENYRLRLDDLTFSYWSSSTPEPPCSDLIVSQRADLDDLFPGALIVDVEPFGQQALWVLPGPIADSLTTADVVTESDPLAPFPPTQSVQLELTLDTAEVVSGSTLAFTITVTNGGPGALFPLQAFNTTTGTVSLGVEFRLAEAVAEPLTEPYRIGLPSVVSEDEGIDVRFEAIATSSAGPLPPGYYVLLVTVVQEGVAWTDFTTSQVVEVIPG